MELRNNDFSLLVFLDLGMDDEGDDDPVPLPNVNAAILKKVSDDFVFVFLILVLGN
jgi:hypothetical protein